MGGFTDAGGRVAWIIVVVAVGARLLLSLHDISLPGLQQDETLFVNAATVRLPNLYIVHQAFGVPLMVFPYIGALKSWIYTPVFDVFGTSPLTIRAPAVVVASGALLLLYPGLRRLAGTPVAVLTIVLLASDNSIFWLTRDDIGPSAIELFCKCAAIFAVSRWALTDRKRWLVCLLAALALGVFNKLNFIWTVNAFVAVSAVALLLRWREAWARRGSLAIWIGGLAVIYLAFAVYYFGEHISLIGAGHNPGLASLISQWRAGTDAILSGTWFYGYALAPQGAITWFTDLYVAFSVYGVVAAALIPRLRNRWIVMAAAVTALTIVQILATPQATAGWHYITIYPFITIVAGYGIYALASTVTRRRTATLALTAAIGAAAVIYSGVWMNRYFGAVGRETLNPAWSSDVYQLDHEIANVNGAVYTADWGIFNPLFALRQSPRYHELAFALATHSPAELAAIGNQLRLTPGQTIIITHTNRALVFPQANRNLFRVTAGRLRLLFVVPPTHPIYDVYLLR